MLETFLANERGSLTGSERARCLLAQHSGGLTEALGLAYRDFWIADYEAGLEEEPQPTPAVPGSTIHQHQVTATGLVYTRVEVPLPPLPNFAPRADEVPRPTLGAPTNEGSSASPPPAARSPQLTTLGSSAAPPPAARSPRPQAVVRKHPPPPPPKPGRFGSYSVQLGAQPRPPRTHPFSSSSTSPFTPPR